MPPSSPNSAPAPTDRFSSILREIGMVVPVKTLQRFDAHCEESGRLPGLNTFLHEPRCASVPQSVRGDILKSRTATRRGVRLLSAVDGQNLTEEIDEITEGMVTIMAVFAQVEKKRLVKKLAAARKRKREHEGRCEGRKPLSETRPEVVALARKLRRRRPKGGQRSLREVSKRLAARGYLNERDKPYAAKSVASMLG
jgi:hypothetical protein